MLNNSSNYASINYPFITHRVYQPQLDTPEYEQAYINVFLTNIQKFMGLSNIKPIGTLCIELMKKKLSKIMSTKYALSVIDNYKILDIKKFYQQYHIHRCIVDK